MRNAIPRSMLPRSVNTDSVLLASITDSFCITLDRINNAPAIPRSESASPPKPPANLLRSAEIPARAATIPAKAPTAPTAAHNLSLSTDASTYTEPASIPIAIAMLRIALEDSANALALKYFVRLRLRLLISDLMLPKISPIVINGLASASTTPTTL